MGRLLSVAYKFQSFGLHFPPKAEAPRSSLQNRAILQPFWLNPSSQAIAPLNDNNLFKKDIS